MEINIVDIIQGENASKYNNINEKTSNMSLFSLPVYLSFPLDSLDEIHITNNNGQRYGLLKYGAYQFLVTRNTVIEMRDQPDERLFIQRSFNPDEGTAVSCSLTENADKTVSVEIEHQRILEDGKIEECSFMIDLEVSAEFWKDLTLKAMSPEQIVNFCLKHSSSKNQSLFSCFSVQTGNQAFELVEDSYRHSNYHHKFHSIPKSFDVKMEKGPISKRIQEFEKFHKQNFLNSQNTFVFELFKKLEPSLRGIVDKTESVVQSKPLLGDDINRLMQANKLVSVNNFEKSNNI